MAVQNKRLRRRMFRILPVVAALAVLLTALVLLGNEQQDAGGFARTYLLILVLTLLALTLLSGVIVVRVVKLVRDVRAEAPGARLSARWVRNFLLLSLPPALIVYAVSGYFLGRTIDNWFDVEVEAALGDSLQLGQEFLDQRTLEVRNQIASLARSLDARDDPESLRNELVGSVSASGPVELTLLDGSGRAVATASFNPLAGLPQRPDDYALLQAQERGEYAAAEPTGLGSLSIRVLYRLPETAPGGPLLLQAIYPLPEAINSLTGSIEREYYRYQNVSYLRQSLKQTFLLILSLVLAMTVLLAILAALTAARRMVAPISSLARATRRVAAGDLEQAVEADDRDEIGFLAQSFNHMTRALAAANREAEQSRASLEAQGKYLETVLGSLSTGVLTLDPSGILVRINRAAIQILDLAGSEAHGVALAKLAERQPLLQPLTEAVHKQLERGRREWQQEVLLEMETRPLVLLVRGSALPEETGAASSGHVVVFDDVTVLNQAQREAAWAEVARRMAHEVKNPLTPIRLAAERLRMKLMDRLAPADAEMLDRSAGTIVSQVEALRKLVDDFGEYAREPLLERAPLQLDRLVEEVVELYRQGDPRLSIALDLCPGPEGLLADAGQVRQLLHNLVRNAEEAAAPGASARIEISTRLLDAGGRRWLELQVRDHGPGFPAEVLARPFEPYVTSKARGSGLGLAICRKIASDHDGSIAISNQPDGGAMAVVRLPVASDRQTRQARA